MNGKVDPYAQWTNDHVEDDGLTIVPTGRPGEELLDPPKPTLDDGVGAIEPGGGIENVGTEEGQLDDESLRRRLDTPPCSAVGPNLAAPSGLQPSCVRMAAIEWDWAARTSSTIVRNVR